MVTFTVASARISELTGSPPVTFLVATISALSSRTSRGTSWSCSSQASPEGATVGKASLPVEVVALVREAANGAPVIRALSSSWTWAGVRTPANDPVTRPAAGGMAVAFQRQGGWCARTTGTLRGLPRAAGASVEALDPDGPAATSRQGQTDYRPGYARRTAPTRPRLVRRAAELALGGVEGGEQRLAHRLGGERPCPRPSWRRA